MSLAVESYLIGSPCLGVSRTFNPHLMSLAVESLGKLDGKQQRSFNPHLMSLAVESDRPAPSPALLRYFQSSSYESSC